MTRRNCLVVGIAIALGVWTPRAEETMPARITGAALTRGGALAFLETLTDTIGGRVTGSPESRAASELILATLKEAGFDNAGGVAFVHRRSLGANRRVYRGVRHLSRLSGRGRTKCG